MKAQNAFGNEFILNAFENKSSLALLVRVTVCSFHMEATEISPRMAKQVFKTELQRLHNIKNFKTTFHLRTDQVLFWKGSRCE